MDINTLRAIGEIAGIALGVLGGIGMGSSRASKVIQVMVDAINQLDKVIGKDEQKRVKQAIRHESLRCGLHDNVSKAVKKAESRNAQQF